MCYEISSFWWGLARQFCAYTVRISWHVFSMRVRFITLSLGLTINIPAKDWHMCFIPCGVLALRYRVCSAGIYECIAADVGVTGMGFGNAILNLGKPRPLITLFDSWILITCMGAWTKWSLWQESELRWKNINYMSRSRTKCHAVTEIRIEKCWFENFQLLQHGSRACQTWKDNVYPILLIENLPYSSTRQHPRNSCMLHDAVSKK